jgi:hypothetical protein
MKRTTLTGLLGPARIPEVRDRAPGKSSLLSPIEKTPRPDHCFNSILINPAATKSKISSPWSPGDFPEQTPEIGTLAFTSPVHCPHGETLPVKHSSRLRAGDLRMQRHQDVGRKALSAVNLVADLERDLHGHHVVRARTLIPEWGEKGKKSATSRTSGIVLKW